MAAKMWQQYRVRLSPQKHFIIAVTSNTANRFIEGSLILCGSRLIYKDEIRVAINHHITMNIICLLIFLFFDKRILYKAQLPPYPICRTEKQSV